MKKFRLTGLMILLCVSLLVGCGGKTDNDCVSSSKSSDISQPQEMSAEELHQYFQQAFDAKGNALDTPEQIALELSEVETLTDTAFLPEDYDNQYKVWRKDYVELLLKTLQEEYNQIIADTPLFDGINGGAAYAEIIDLDQDKLPELLLISLSPAIDNDGVYGWDGAVTLYEGKSGHAQPCGGETIPFPPFYHSDYDPKTLSLVQNGERTYIRRLETQGRNVVDSYYGVNNGTINIVEEITADEASRFSSGNEITLEEYEAIQAKYTDEIVLLADTTSITPVRNRGVLPDISSEAKIKMAFLEVLNAGNIKYAKLLDLNQDGNEDLIVVEKSADRYIYCIYSWNGTEVERIPFENMYFGLDIEGGIYRKKSTGELYLYCNNSYDGAYDTTYYFANLSDSDMISTEDYEHIWEEYAEGWHFSDAAEKAFSDRLNKYEVVEEFRLYYPDYNDYISTVSNAAQKLFNR